MTNPNFMWCPRADWGMDVSKLSPRLVHQPVPTIFIHHSVTTATANPCHDMKALEAIGISRFGRLSYSAAVHPSGVVLEGANERVGAHTENRNSTALGLVFIGDLTKTVVTSEALRSAVDTINLWRLGGACAASPVIVGHRSVKATACPGMSDDAIGFIRLWAGGKA